MVTSLVRIHSFEAQVPSQLQCTACIRTQLYDCTAGLYVTDAEEKKAIKEEHISHLMQNLVSSKRNNAIW